MTTLHQPRDTPPEAPQRQADDLSDRWAIFDLVGRFDDAVNRRDVDEFSQLWAPDAVWEINDPKPMRVEGAAEIAKTWRQMLGALEWLFRGSFTGVISVDGERAMGRWPCIETGNYVPDEKGVVVGYDNRAVNEDRYSKLDGRWVFQSRSYHYLWLDSDKLSGQPVPLGHEDPFTSSGR